MRALRALFTLLHRGDRAEEESAERSDRLFFRRERGRERERERERGREQRERESRERERVRGGRAGRRRSGQGMRTENRAGERARVMPRGSVKCFREPW